MLNFFSVDTRIRAAVVFAGLIIVFWWILGKVILRLASLLPWLLQSAFKGMYLLIETPICFLHEKVGLPFYNVDNRLAAGGGRIDVFLKGWYSSWHSPKSRQIVLSIVVYCVLLIWIFIPYHVDEPNAVSFSGQRIYLIGEEKVMHWLKINNSYMDQTEEAAVYDEIVLEEKKFPVNIAMKVVTKNSPLSVRDIPSVENCEILKKVEKESTVFWKGEIAFGKGDKGDTEPWVKVETSDGTVGWVRLIYLCPLNEEDFELKLQVD